MKLSRRTALKAAGVSIALPPLEAMWNSHGTAYANGDSFPRRFGVFFWGNGVLPEQWVPTADGAAWEPSALLMPLAKVRENLLVVSGLRVATANTAPHMAGPAGLFTGDQVRNGTYSAATVDQRIAQVIGADTRFRSLETGVQRSDRSLSHRGPNLMNPAETDPAALFQRLFGDGFRAPGDMSAPDPKLQLKRSVLDAVMGQSARLKARVSAADRIRLDSHLEGIRALELQLQRQQQGSAALACKRPDAPPSEIPDLEGRPNMRERSRLMSELLVMALACDLSRVFFHMYSQPVNNVLFGDASAGHHQLTHDELGEQPQVQRILGLVLEDLASLVAGLRAIPEGTGTLLDHCLVLATTDCSYGRTHSLDEYPVLLAGGRALGFKQNHHLRARGDNASKLMLTLQQSFGVRATEYGVGPGHVAEGLPGVLA